MSIRTKSFVLLSFMMIAALARAASPEDTETRQGKPEATKPNWHLEASTAPLDVDDFAGRLLIWSYFKAAAAQEQVLVVDVRSGFLTQENMPGLTHARPIPLDIFIPNFLARKAHQEMTLLLIDEDGTNLKTLQYYLKKYGYDDYFFLEGGATAAFRALNNRS